MYVCVCVCVRARSHLRTWMRVYVYACAHMYCVSACVMCVVNVDCMLCLVRLVIGICLVFRVLVVCVVGVVCIVHICVWFVYARACVCVVDVCAGGVCASLQRLAIQPTTHEHSEKSQQPHACVTARAQGTRCSSRTSDLPAEGPPARHPKGSGWRSNPVCLWS